MSRTPSGTAGDAAPAPLDPGQAPRPHDDPSHHAASPPLSATGPLLLWLSVQLIALALAAARVPLAAKYPEPHELLAIHLMLVVQLGLAALLFPFLMRDWKSSVVVVATSWPLLVAAGQLSALTPAALLAPAAHVTGWLVMLAVWRGALRGRYALAVASTAATALALGGAGLAYLAAEFGSGRPDTAPSGARFGPIPAALAALSPTSSHSEGVEWRVAFTALLITGLLFIAHRRRV